MLVPTTIISDVASMHLDTGYNCWRNGYNLHSSRMDNGRTFRQPKAMKLVQDEVRYICRGKSNITYPDEFENMDYLKAVVKETTNHRKVPLLVVATPFSS